MVYLNRNMARKEVHYSLHLGKHFKCVLIVSSFNSIHTFYIDGGNINWLCLLTLGTHSLKFHFVLIVLKKEDNSYFDVM